MSASNWSIHRCPVCGGHLRFIYERASERRVFMYCSIGRCHSEAANEGAWGLTEREAYDALRKAVDAEPTVLVE